MGCAKLLEGSLLLFLFVSSIGAEAAMCETRSQVFRGACFRSDNCGAICEKEGFLTGKCKGFLRKCICAKDCGGNSAGAGDAPPDTPSADTLLMN